MLKKQPRETRIFYQQLAIVEYHHEEPQKHRIKPEGAEKKILTFVGRVLFTGRARREPTTETQN